MAQKSGGGGALLLMVLVVLVGAGGWNYWRNLQAERAEFRPFRGYAEEDLARLYDAYRGESETYEKRYRSAGGREVRVREAPLLGDQIEEFERVQRISRGKRELGARLAEREGALAQIERERKKRAEERELFTLHLRRLVTIRF